jgi:hypothetical protein
MICPVCVANAAMAVAGVTTSAGGASAIVVRVLRWRKGRQRRRRTEERFFDCATGRAAIAERKSEFQSLRSE